MFSWQIRKNVYFSFGAPPPPAAAANLNSPDENKERRSLPLFPPWQKTTL
jgi:hypothetical protein